MAQQSIIDQSTRRQTPHQGLSYLPPLPSSHDNGDLARRPEPAAALLHPTVHRPPPRSSEQSQRLNHDSVIRLADAQTELRQPGTRHPLRPRLRQLLPRQLSNSGWACEEIIRPSAMELHQRVACTTLRGSQDDPADPPSRWTDAARATTQRTRLPGQTEQLCEWKVRRLSIRRER